MTGQLNLSDAKHPFYSVRYIFTNCNGLPERISGGSGCEVSEIMGKIHHQTLRERVEEEIRAKIVNQELLPGMRIVEQDISEELGVSRGPIREALRQLEQEGMIEYTRNVGCSVRKNTLEDLYEIYMLRSTYEILAVRAFGGKFTEQELKQMDQILEQMGQLEDDYGKLDACDHELHRIIIEKSGFERLIKAWSDLNYGNAIRFCTTEARRKDIVKRQYSVHKVIVDVCRTGDVEKICEALNQHYMSTVKRLMEEQNISDSRFRF